MTLSGLRLHGTDHQRLGLSRHSLGRPCLHNSPPRDRAVPQFRHSSGGAASEHTQLPEKVPSCPPRARKVRPLSKATSGPQIFPDPPLALKHSLGLLKVTGFIFFIFIFVIITIIYTTINISFCVVCYSLQRSSPSSILLHSLIKSRRLREAPTVRQAQGHRAGEELGLLSTTPPLFCTGCFTHMSPPHAL